jgi:hypothetical protein
MAETAAQKKARLAAAAKAEAARKEAAYIASFSNPITSQNDPRISENPGVFGINGPTWQQLADEADAAASTLKIADDTAKPKAGTVIRYKPGSKPGLRIAVYADGAGGEFDGAEEVDPTFKATEVPTVKKKVVSTYVDPKTGDIINVFDDGTEAVAKKGTKELDALTAKAAADAEKTARGQSAFNLLSSEFESYGMGALVGPLRQFIEEGISRDEFVLRLRGTDAYKKRFAANAQRVTKGLRSLSEAEYIQKEDAYQDVMRRYGLPETYYTRGDMGRQEGFEKFIAGDVSSVELEDRIASAQRRVINSNPEVSKALKEFYPGISNGDILAYVLDPTNAIEEIKRKITAAEIGGAAMQTKLDTSEARARELATYGINKQTATEEYANIAGGLQRGSQLASIYGEDPYTQTTAETERFNLQGAQEARTKRQKITGLEKAAFSGQSGLSSSALARDRAGAY